jgi:high affinity sulfate transporter 1
MTSAHVPRAIWLRADVVAGLTAAAVVVPKAMAYATVAGLPVQVGLYTAMIPMAIYAMLGTSRPLSVSTTTTLAILVGTELQPFASGDAIASLLGVDATLTLLVGAILVGAGVARLGFVANFISEPVLVGFKSGIGLVIIADQIPKLLGVQVAKGSFLQTLSGTLHAIPGTSRLTLAIGATTLVVLLILELRLPSVPAPLVAVAGGIAAATLFDLARHGVHLTGAVPGGLPSIVLPDLALAGSLWAGALGIALMSFTETIAAGRVFARPDEPPINPDRELIATGLANAGGAFFGAMSAGGGTSQTAVNRRAGARTQFAEIVTAATTLLIILFLARPMALLPQATLAAVVIVYSTGLISPRAFLRVRAVRRLEFGWALVAFAGVVLLGTLRGILAAVLVSVVALAQQSATPPVYVLGRKRGTNVFRAIDPAHPTDETFSGLLLLRVEGRVFFLNAARIGERMRRLIAEHSPNVVALDLSGVFDMEYTALKALITAEEQMRQAGICIWLVGLTPRVLEVVRRSPLGALLGRERMHFNLETAVRAYLKTTAVRSAL